MRNSRSWRWNSSPAAGALMNEYVKGEERSFTIIAFPVPEIGDNFEEIFDGVLHINTLDYTLYQGIQQKIIDTLDKAAYVRIKGCGANRTDLKVVLHRLENPEKETNFENCVADVNIPVGEVFTSPGAGGYAREASCFQGLSERAEVPEPGD